MHRTRAGCASDTVAQTGRVGVRRRQTYDTAFVITIVNFLCIVRESLMIESAASHWFGALVRKATVGGRLAGVRMTRLLTNGNIE